MRYSPWSVPFENPFFAIFEIVNAGTAYEKHIIVKVCKSIQTVKKYVLNSDKPMGWSIWCKDVYPGIEAFVQIGDDAQSLSFRNKIEKLKQNKIYIAL